MKTVPDKRATTRHDLCSLALILVALVTPNAWSQPLLEHQKVLASDGSGGDLFGWELSVQGASVFVGAPSNDDSLSSGFVYLYSVNTETAMWDETQKLKAPDPAPRSWFGHAIDVCDDVLVVGTKFTDIVYIYRRLNGVWQCEQELVTPSGEAEEFGFDVAVDGDVLAVGTPSWRGAGVSTKGATYIYRYDDVAIEWNLTQELHAFPIKHNGQKFGLSVEVAGPWLAVSGTEFTPNEVYVFWTEDWAPFQNFTAPDPRSLCSDLIDHRPRLTVRFTTRHNEGSAR